MEFSPGYFSYHHLHVTTARIPRARLFDLPYGLEVTCSRVSGWQLWRIPDIGRTESELLGGEYDGPDKWLVVLAGYVILDSRRKEDGT